jgi:integrase
VELLRAHKKHQAEIKLGNRTIYRDFGSCSPGNHWTVRSEVAHWAKPVQGNNLGQREYATLIKAATVRPIKFHGLRHMCATLLLQAGQPVHAVSERLATRKYR